MATVPTYEPQIDQKPLPGFRQESVATPTLLGGMVDSAVQAGKDLNEIGAQLNIAQERQDMTAVLGVETARKEKLIAADAEMRKNMQGANAAGATKAAKDWWDAAAKEDFAALQTDAQRQVYLRRMSATRLSSIHGVSQFEAQQGDIVLTESTKAAVTAAINTASANALDTATQKPDEVGIALQQEAITTALTAYYTRRGGNKKGPNGEPSPLDVALGDAKTRLHKEVLQALPPELARDYFLAHEQEIDGTQRDAIGKAARQETADAIGRNAAKEAVAALGYGAGIDVILEKLDKQFGSDTVTLKAAHAAAKDLVSTFEHGEKTRMDSMKAKVNLRLLNGESWGTVARGPEMRALMYEAGPAGIAAAGQIQDHQESLAATRASRAASASGRSYTEAAHRQLDLTKSGMNTYLDLVMNPDKLAAKTSDEIINLRTEMSDQQVQHLAERQLQLTKGADALAAAKLDANTFKLVARSVGLDPDKKPSEMSDDDKRRLETLNLAASDALKQANIAKGRAITDPKERYETVKKAVFDIVRVPGFFFGGTDLPVSVLTPAEMVKAVVNTDLGKVRLAEIPKEFRDAAAADYDARDKTLTQRSLARDWLYSQQQANIKKFKGPTGPYLGGR